MEKRRIKIEISGEPNAGKSRITYLLKKFLSENGFKVEFNGGVDFHNENQFNNFMSRNIEQATEYIKSNRIIDIDIK